MGPWDNPQEKWTRTERVLLAAIFIIGLPLWIAVGAYEAVSAAWDTFVENP